MGAVRRFGTDQRGAVGMIFGLALLPVMGLLGGAVDYSRAAAEHAKLQRAADATALALVKQARTADQRQLDAAALSVFDSLYAPLAGVALADPVVKKVESSLIVAREGRITNAFMQVLGVRDMGLRAESRVAWSNERIELALVLDNTGSMNDLIGSKRKIDELKVAAKDLIDELRRVAIEKDDVRVSVVPFDTEVRVDPAKYRNKDWIRWTDRNSAAERNGWTGYIVDRHQPYDVRDDAPAMSVRDTLYTKLQASQWASKGALAFVQPLVSLHEASASDAVKATIASMQPRGNTNVGLGVSWGVATLTGSVPLDAPGSADRRKVRRFMVVLTDGKNTQHYADGVARYGSGNASDPNTRAINDRTSLACAMAKDPTKGAAEVFTIRLLEGDVDLLRGCASPSNSRVAKHYFDVQSAAELKRAFADILDAISGTRLTH